MARAIIKVCARGGKIKDKQKAWDSACRFTLEVRPPPTGGAGGWSPSRGQHPHSSSPNREERRGATRRRGAAFTRRQPRAATAEDARPPRRPTHPPRGDVLTTGGTRALRAWEGAGASAPPRSDRGRAYRSNNVPPRLPKRSGRAAPSAAQAAPQGRARRPRGRER